MAAMRRMNSILVTAIITALLGGCDSATPHTPAANYLYTSIGEFDEQAKPLLDRPDIQGVQVVVPWAMLEREQDKYDFSEFDQVVKYVESKHKKLFLQLQDRFFEPPARVPTYLLNDPKYAGGVAEQKNEDGPVPGPPGSVAAQWNKHVQDRWQRLVTALAGKFDGRIEGINLPESAVSIDTDKDKSGFTCARYFDATLENMAFTKKAFTKSHVVQYINFWPCDDQGGGTKNLERSFAFAKEHGVGVGGPDLVPYNEAHMDNGYKFFNRDKGNFSLVAIAVQEPDFEYTSPKTGQKYSKQEFVDFANDYMGANIIFWALNSPWLHEK
ncbi:hypothetical protein D5S17_08040 [Pseudonocardiaceae bacterium YIM PH 21723]|nr:hypothetical protein D5S17_08040 [Pseudonocardiaceae bacterium YIM PH 21723]